MPDWIGLLMVLGFVSIVLLVYMLITRSAGIYASPRQFWLALALSAAIAYVLSGGLFLFLHNATVAVAVSAIVPFLIGNLDLGEPSREPAPTDEERAAEEPVSAEDEEAEEDEAAADGEAEVIGNDISFNHVQNNHVHNDLL